LIDSNLIEDTLKPGEEHQCGWLKEKFRVSWQIVPTVLGELMSDKDPEKACRVTQAMLEMVKLYHNIAPGL
jgi:predicted 3-demethylubiquinone-9 3-methyltransferase (glyoxalase superfamily)